MPTELDNPPDTDDDYIPFEGDRPTRRLVMKDMPEGFWATLTPRQKLDAIRYHGKDDMSPG